MGTIENKELIFVLVLFGGVVCTYLLYLMHTQATLWPKKIPKAKATGGHATATSGITHRSARTGRL